MHHALGMVHYEKIQIFGPSGVLEMQIIFMGWLKWFKNKNKY
jgi:hypothetical protein